MIIVKNDENFTLYLSLKEYDKVSIIAHTNPESVEKQVEIIIPLTHTEPKPLEIEDIFFNEEEDEYEESDDLEGEDDDWDDDWGDDEDCPSEEDEEE